MNGTMRLTYEDIGNYLVFKESNVKRITKREREREKKLVKKRNREEKTKKKFLSVTSSNF